jgi:hypothetical protein
MSAAFSTANGSSKNMCRTAALPSACKTKPSPTIPATFIPHGRSLETRLGLIPILGGIDENVLFNDQDGKTAFEKEVEYFGALLEKYPERAVIYKDKPLMVIFLGAAQDPNRSDHPLWFQIRQFLREHPEISSKYTFNMMAGYLDSQPGL